jgi:6-phosphogluconolactonase (cycloisomerase 2 family)
MHKGAAMRIGNWARLLLAAAPLLAGCGDFWQAPGSNSSTSFTLTNSGNINVSPGATGNSTITVTPGSSFTGTVTLSCSITSTPTNVTSATTCGLSSDSLTFSSSTAQTTTLTATTESGTPPGAYEIKVTGVSGSIAASTSLCAEVSTSSSATCSNASSTSGNFYVLGSTSIAGYYINAGTLTTLSGSSYTLTGASAIAMAPSGDFLYVASTSGLTLYTINSSTGALTSGGVIFDDPLALAIQVDPSGDWLLDASDDGTLKAYPITSTGIEDTSRSAQTTMNLASNSVQPGGIAISPNGALIAVALGTKGTELFPFASGTIGSPYTKLLSPYGSGGAAVAVAMDPQSRLLYVGETAAFNSTTNSGALRVYTIGTNSVNELTYATPYAPAGTGIHAILPAASGNYVYAASWQSGGAGEVTGYSVTTSALTALSTTVTTGTEPVGLAEDSNDSYVLAVSTSGTEFDAYTFDSTTTGQLDSSLTGTTASAPVAIVAVPK